MGDAVGASTQKVSGMESAAGGAAVAGTSTHLFGDPSQSGPPDTGSGLGADSMGVGLDASSDSRLSDSCAADGSPKWKNKQIGRFRLIDVIGKGMMGKVFEAEDVELHRHVALKIIGTRSKDPTLSRRVQQLIAEARAAAKLAHPHVVNIYDIGGLSNIYYIAMELVEGGSLQGHVERQGPMAIGRACRLTREAAAALDYAHECGIVHRDVKPGNLMLTRSDRCKLADFGLARTINPTASADGPSAGTPLYLAPEVIRGQPESPGSDVYSLGASLWFLLTGRPPFDSESHNVAEIVGKHLHEPVPDPRKRRADLPAGLAGVMAQALAKEPAKRYPSADAFAQALFPYADLPQAPRSAGWNGATPHASRRRRLDFMAALLMMAVLGAGIAYFFMRRQWRAVAPSAIPAATRPAATRAAAQRGDRFTPAGLHLFSADETAALLEVADGRDDDDPPDVQVAVEGTVVATALGSTGQFYRIQFSPDWERNFVCAYPLDLDPEIRDIFPSPPGSQMLGLIGKRIRVTGTLVRFKERPQIMIDLVEQIEVLE